MSSVLEHPAFSMDVETCIEPGTSTRRFRWRLTAPRQPSRVSAETFATKREATKDGEIALERARHPGHWRRR